jgi:hypothetical protein
MILNLKKENGYLIPADKHSQELFEGLKFNQWYKSELKIPRHYEFHCKLFVLMGDVVDQSDLYTGVPKEIAMDELLERIKKATGHYYIWEFQGIEFKKTKSISFAKMDGIKFQAFYETAVLAIRNDEQLNVPDLALEGF